MSPSITMWGVADIDILACTFDNRLTNHLKYQGGAIYTQKASYKVGELSNQGCVFKGYADAIRSEDDFSIGFPIKIIGAYFNDNIHSIYLNDANGARVSHNEFFVRTQHNYIPPTGQNFQTIAYGLYLDYTSGFAVEDNDFTNLDNTANISAAIVVKDNGGATDQLYNNEIDGFYHGIQAIGNNQNSAVTDLGLNFICNDCGPLTANSKDIIVSNYGKVGNLQGEGTRLPNNRFSASGTSRHFDNFGLSTITYEHGTGDPRLVPINYIGLNPNGVLNFVDIAIECPSIPKPEALPGAVLSELNAVEIGLSNDRALLAQLIDQGNTPQLEAQILFASNQLEYQKLYIDLINMAPFVSTDNLLQLIQIDDYPELALRNVLLANPHAIREGEVWEAIINRSPVLSQQTIDDLETGKQSITARDVLDQQIAGNQVLSERLSGQFLRYYAEHSDTNAFDAIAIIKQHLQNRDELHYKYALIDLHLSLNEWALARQELEAIPQQCVMGEQEEIDFQSIQSYYNLFLDGNLVESQLEGDALETIQELEATGSGYAVGKARALLKLNGYNVSYVEPIIDQNGLLLNKREMNLERPAFPVQSFSLFPNPARDRVALQWEAPSEALFEDGLKVQIRNSSGQLVLEESISDPALNSHLISIENWKPGLYLVQVLQGEEAIYQEKLIKQP